MISYYKYGDAIQAGHLKPGRAHRAQVRRAIDKPPVGNVRPNRICARNWKKKRDNDNERERQLRFSIMAAAQPVRDWPSDIIIPNNAIPKPRRRWQGLQLVKQCGNERRKRSGSRPAGRGRRLQPETEVGAGSQFARTEPARRWRHGRDRREPIKLPLPRSNLPKLRHLPLTGSGNKRRNSAIVFPYFIFFIVKTACCQFKRETSLKFSSRSEILCWRAHRTIFV